jgi:subtilisin family serine protease
VAAVVLAAFPARATAADIIVKREPGLDRTERADVRRDAGVTLAGATTLPDTEIVHADDPQAALAALNADPSVAYAEPDGTLHALADDPGNDPMFWLQWALKNDGTLGGVAGDDMHVPDAWKTTTGAGITVAVVDSGVNGAVTDLQSQVGANTREIPGNGIDDDHDGLVDDVRGWDFISNDNDPVDQMGHGTHVAGIIAAESGNGAGVEGVAPDARVLPIRVLNGGGAGSDSTIAQGLDYAGDLGIRIVNVSLGGPGASQTLTDAMAAHPGTLYVIAAGNSNADNDGAPEYPCTAPLDNVLCVGASDEADRKASFSNYGAHTVDVFAPGTDIVSTLNTGNYGFMSGTSMAAPNVAGVAALALAANPAATTAQLKQAIIGSVDSAPALAGLSVSSGRVDAPAAVAAIRAMPLEAQPTGTPQPTATPAPPPAPAEPAPAPPVQAAPPVAPAQTAPATVQTLKVRKLRATFVLTRGAAVRVSLVRRGSATKASVAWTLSAHGGANTLNLEARARRLKPGRYVLTVAAGGSARAAAVSVH